MSTIKVDTIQTRSGVSEIGIDKLKGASSASSISVVGEGGTTTTNLQQGLCKCWNNFDALDTFTLQDSFNVSSLTDNGVGLYTVNFSNLMGNANYATAGMAQNSLSESANLPLVGARSATLPSTSSFKAAVTTANTVLTDVDVVRVIAHGDLA